MENNKTAVLFKVYGLVLEAKEQIFLSIQYATSLEDAFGMAKLEYETLNPSRTGINNPFLGSKIWLFTIKSVADLVNGKVTLSKVPMQYKRLRLEGNKTEKVVTKEEEIKIQKGMIETIKKEIDPKVIKNSLMRRIIKDKNLELLEQSKSVLAPHEIKYIEDTMKGKKKNSPLDK